MSYRNAKDSFLREIEKEAYNWQSNERKAVICFVRKNNKILLIYDYYPTGSIWNAISGYIDREKTSEQAVIREVKEEIDIELNIKDLKKNW